MHPDLAIPGCLREFELNSPRAVQFRVDFYQGSGNADIFLSWKSVANGINSLQGIPTQYMTTPE